MDTYNADILPHSPTTNIGRTVGFFDRIGLIKKTHFLFHSSKPFYDIAFTPVSHYVFYNKKTTRISSLNKRGKAGLIQKQAADEQNIH